ncbi:MAG: hypothetical protein ACPG4U_15055 [Pseudomonadales bacterium]
MKLSRLCVITCACFAVTACNTTPNKAEAEAGSDASTVTEPVAAAAQPESPAAPAAPVRAVNSTDPSEISRLQAQVTALQEQSIKQSSDTNSLLKMTQLLLAQQQAKEVKAQGVTKAQPQAVAAMASDSQSLNKVLQRLDEVAISPGGAFGLVSSYTASRQWILIRFDRNTGESWLADKNGWALLNDSDTLPISQYDVHVVRGDQDQKGYVAARIDQRTGETWWLNQRQWVKYE